MLEYNKDKKELEKCCVCINVFAKCEKDKDYDNEKDEYCYKEELEKCCVCINVFAKCKKDKDYDNETDEDYLEE